MTVRGYFPEWVVSVKVTSPQDVMSGRDGMLGLTECAVARDLQLYELPCASGKEVYGAVVSLVIVDVEDVQWTALRNDPYGSDIGGVDRDGFPRIGGNACAD